MIVFHTFRKLSRYKISEFSQIFTLPEFKFLALEQPNAPDIPLVMTDWYYANADEIYTSNPFNDGGTDMQHGTTKHYCSNALKSYDHGVRVGFSEISIGEGTLTIQFFRI